MKEPAEEEEDEPIRTPEESCIPTPLAHGLCLGSHVRRQEDAQQGQGPDPKVAVGGERDAANHEDIGIAVEDMVQEIPAQGCLARHLRDLPVEGVEVGVDENQSEGEPEEARAAEEEGHAGTDGPQEGDPRDEVRIHADQPRCNRNQDAVRERAVAV